MPSEKLSPILDTIDLSKANGPSEAKVVVVNLPANTVGIIFGQRTAGWKQRFNTYLLDKNNLVEDPQAVWDAPSEQSRFVISLVQPPGAAEDPSVLCINPSSEDRRIAVYCSHKSDSDQDFKQSDPKYTSHDFQIGTKHAISFAMINAEDGGDSDYHDTVVGIAVAYLYK